MDNIQRIDQLMTELGPHMDLDKVYRHRNNNWSLFISDTRETFIDHLETDGKLMFSSDLILPDRLKPWKNESSIAERSVSMIDKNAELDHVHHLNRFYTCLLNYNVLWQETACAALGLIDSSNKVELSFNVVAENQNLETLTTHTRFFDELAKRWQYVIDNFSSKNVGTSSIDIPTHPHHMIKV